MENSAPKGRSVTFASFGLRTITMRDTEFVYEDGSPFNVVKYSRFKYGDTNVAAAYGLEMSTRLKACVLDAAERRREPVVITASAYKMLPTAARSLVQVIHDRLHADGYKIDSGRIHRLNLTNGDYAAMSTEERESAMRQNGIHIDEELFLGRHVIVVDDIKITGAHERSIREMFTGRAILSLTHIYVVQMDPRLVAEDPTAEDTLNRAWVNGLDQLSELIRANPSEYLFNARTVKLILSSEPAELCNFLDTLTTEHIQKLYEGATGDGYQLMAPYTAGFACLAAEARARGIVQQGSSLQVT